MPLVRHWRIEVCLASRTGWVEEIVDEIVHVGIVVLWSLLVKH